MQYKPAIVVVAYNRADSLQRLLGSIECANYDEENVTLIISIDYAPDNRDVIELAKSFQWKHGEKIVKTHEINLGLRKHIFECGDYAEKYGAIVLLEDDLLVAPDFYRYVMATHNYYGENERVAGIALYSHEWNGYAQMEYKPIQNGFDVYFAQFSVTWGQSWTKQQWRKFKDWVNKNQKINENYKVPEAIWHWKESWGKLFVYYIQETDKYYVMPYNAMSTCFSEIGVHTTLRDTRNQVNLFQGRKEKYNYPQFEQGIHYNLFFENMDIVKYLKIKSDNNNVCVDLYAMQQKYYSMYEYVLTSVQLPYQIIKGYSLEMRPWDLNILYNIEGKDVYLYDMKVAIGKRQYKRNKKNLVYYEFYGRRWWLCLYFGLIEFFRLSFNKIKKIIGILK